MTTRRNLLIIGIIAVLLLVLALLTRQWLAGQEISLESGIHLASEYRLAETYDGDLVVIAQTIVLEAGSRVMGNASLIGDSIVVNGVVQGDLTTLGDSIKLEPGSHVEGNAVLTGSSVSAAGQVDGDVQVTAERLTIDANAAFRGVVTPCTDIVDDSRADAPALRACSHKEQFAPFETLIGLRNQSVVLDGTQLAAPVSAGLMLVLGSLTLVSFSTLAVTMFPRQISHIEEAIRSRPRSLVGAGFATFLLIVGLSTGLLVLLAVAPPLGLVLIPVFLLLGLGLLVLVVAGLVTLSLVLGEWLVARVGRLNAPPLITVVVGSLVLSAALTIIVLLPFGFLLGVAALALVSSVGVGAALLTRMGTRPLRRSYFIQG